MFLNAFIQLCFTTFYYTTGWRQLKIGIIAGCTIPTRFHSGNGGHYQGLKVGCGWERLQGGPCLPPIKAFMDDMTTMTLTAPCTSRLQFVCILSSPNTTFWLVPIMSLDWPTSSWWHSFSQVACERTFSTLKFMKNRLRTTLTQDRFEAFKMISIVWHRIWEDVSW